ncbi:MAG: DNA polymerase [Methanothrix sp.]|nr:DNA polymerase [Methanothrix sp.]
MTKALLTSWSCKPRKESSTLYLHLSIAGSSPPRSAKLKIISIAGDYGQALLSPELLPEIFPLLECPACRVVGHNLLSDLGVIRFVSGRRLVLPNLWDTMLASQLLNNGLSYRGSSLPSICRDLLGWHFDDSPEASGRKGEPSAKEMDYAARACAILERIQAKQKSLLKMQGLERVAQVEFKAIPALVEIEYNGIGFDSDKGLRLLESLVKERDRLERELQSYAKSWKIKGFNPRNPAHVKNVLRRNGFNVESTSAACLERILSKNPDEPFINSLLKYRELRQKIGFLKNWTDFAREDRIYPKLVQLGGRSGRITCSRPNIQQVPRDRSSKGLFVASQGMSFVEADFSAIEMRIIAVLSGDKAMQKIFKKGLDPHKRTAQAIFQKNEISDEERQIAKTLNYGTIYGGGANMILSRLPDLTEDDARDFLYRFYDAYPDLKRWQQMVSEGARTITIDGETYKISRSALGRIRYVDPQHRNALINTPVQSTGADLQKIALGRLYEKLATPKYIDFRLINAVHDSILLEVPDKRKGEASKLLQGVMEEAGNGILKVIPCLTDVKVGKDWSFDRDHRGLGGIFSNVASMLRRVF